jgi:hypothetical protein
MLANLKSALDVVRGASPDEIKQLDEAEKAAQAEAERATRKKADAAAKVDRALAERTELIVADYHALEEQALHQAAEDLARAQLSVETGLEDPQRYAIAGWPTRLAPRRVNLIRDRLAGSEPLPWARGHKSADGYRSAKAAETAAIRQADERAQRAERGVLSHDEAEALAAQRQMQMEAQRAKAIEERKAAARRAGLLPAVKP